jgi:hypothetical protein
VSPTCLVHVIFRSARPGPLARPRLGLPANLTARAWAEILKPANFFGPSPARNAIFSYFAV